MTNFLLLHGWGGNSPDHWQNHLAAQLRAGGTNVFDPQLPNAGKPDIDEWIKAIEPWINAIDTNKLVVACHSLGCSLWSHYLSKHPDIKPLKAFYVAPPPTKRGYREFDHWFPLPQKEKGQKDIYTIIGSGNDEFIKKEEFEAYAKQLGISFKYIPNAGHLNPSSGYGKWPWMEQECLKLL